MIQRSIQLLFGSWMANPCGHKSPRLNHQHVANVMDMSIQACKVLQLHFQNQSRGDYSTLVDKSINAEPLGNKKLHGP